MTARVGDVIETAEQLDALPVGSVVLASTGKAYQRAHGGGERGYGVVWAEAGEEYLTQPLVMVRWAPLTVLHVPGEQQAVPATPVGGVAVAAGMATAIEWESELADLLNTVRMTTTSVQRRDVVHAMKLVVTAGMPADAVAQAANRWARGEATPDPEVERIARALARTSVITGRDALGITEAAAKIGATPPRPDVIEKVARVIHGEVVLAAQSREIDIQVHDTVSSIRFERGIARALADAGLLARELPTRGEIARAIADYYGTRARRDDAWDAVTDRQRAELLGIADAMLALLEGRQR